jgi:predicted dehydrogenase
MKLICDLDRARLDHIKGLYPTLETCTNLEEVLQRDDIDSMVIATPVCYHYDMAKRCLKAGKHVLVEKPMAHSAQECRELIDIAGSKGLTLMVGHTFIYSPAVRRIREIIARSDLGRIHYIGARRLNLGLFQKDINVAWDLAPHDISIILYVLGEAPIGVNCQGRAHVVHGIEDVTNLTLSFASGTFATIQSSWLDPNKVREITFVGDKQMLVYNDMEPLEKIKIYDKRVEVPPHYDSFAEFQYSYHYGDVYSPYVKQVESLKFECQHFVDCITNNAVCDSDGVQGMVVVRILEAASASLRNCGGRVDITMPKTVPAQ